jgi:hypothetical protein
LNLTKLIVILSTVIVAVILIFAISQVALAKHHDNDSNKDKGTQATDQPKASDDQLGKTTDVPVPSVISGQIPTNTIAESKNCTNGSDHSNDKICANTETNQEQTISTPQSTPIPQVNPLVNTDASSNPSTTTPTTIKNNNVDNEQDSSGGSTSTSSSGGSDSEDEQIKAHNNLGADSKFILIAQDGKVDLFTIESNERELDTGLLPKLIHPIESFDTASDALTWLNGYDNR